MEWTTEQVQREVRRSVNEATEQLRRAYMPRQIVVKRDGCLIVLDIVSVTPSHEGMYVEVADHPALL